MERHFFAVLVLWIFFTAVCPVVSSTRLIRCPAQGPYKSYTCPRFYDPPDQTRCCFWNGPACCLPGGNSCSDRASHIRNYCPGPNDGKNDRVCCTVNNKGKCCHVGLVAGIVSGVGLLVIVVVFVVCWCSPICPLAKYRQRRQLLNVPTVPPSGIYTPQGQNTTAAVSPPSGIPQWQNTAAAPPSGIPQWPPGYK